MGEIVMLVVFVVGYAAAWFFKFWLIANYDKITRIFRRRKKLTQNTQTKLQ